MTGFISGLQIGTKLGSGAFGEVFQGKDPAHGVVAVKVLKRQSFHDNTMWPVFKSRYLAEAANLSKASHRNVVHVHHVVEASDGESVIICMAFCPGGSLQEQFEKGPMKLLSVRKVGTEIAMGLGAMHARGMVHRDIKPANVLLNAKGEAQISDFGLVTDDLVLGYASQAGYADHVAYEVWNGKGTSAKSDIWALGMTLYRLIHGKTWYEESPRPVNLVKNGGFANTLKWLPHVPSGWRRVIRKMLNDNDGARYQNAAQALNGLADLPVFPSWDVTVTPDLIRWNLLKGSRLRAVEWRRVSARKHEWEAWSEPVGTGKKRRLGGSGGFVSRREAIEGLESFFEV